MKSFKSLGSFVAYLENLQAKLPIYKAATLTMLGQHLQDAAKRKFGVYQFSVGAYPAWQQLAASTQKERVRLGYSANDPLFRTGELLMDSIHYHVIDNTMQFGSTTPIMTYIEFGTVKMPPRPVLGPTMFENEAFILSSTLLMLNNWFLGLGLAKYG